MEKPLKTSDYTKEYIMTALFRLMKVKEYSKITISEIAARAGVGRVTYYRNFKDKDDIIIQFFRINQENLQGELIFVKPRSKEDYMDRVVTVLKEFRSKKEIIQLLMDANLEHIYYDYLNEGMHRNFLINYPNINSISSYIFSGALCNLQLAWLKNGCQETEEELAKILLDVILP